ncbi:hypothetical protein OG285_05685 [Streptomyces sp. NBC_01471]|uniref:hypothetical protein n=1 Tax=Streptomyces sp. NBC_01471 TaxID=2903879 RepID=UPI00324A70E7
MPETASQWCRAHGVRSASSELDAIADRLSDLGQELHLTGQYISYEINSSSHREAAAALVSPAASTRGTSVGQQSDAPAPFPPPAARSLPRSR